jgi:hypothetical protein
MTIEIGPTLFALLNDISRAGFLALGLYLAARAFVFIIKDL